MSRTCVGPFKLGIDDKSRELITKWFVEVVCAELLGKDVKARALISMCVRHISRLIEIERAFGILIPRIEDW